MPQPCKLVPQLPFRVSTARFTAPGPTSAPTCSVAGPPRGERAGQVPLLCSTPPPTAGTAATFARPGPRAQGTKALAQKLAFQGPGVGWWDSPRPMHKLPAARGDSGLPVPHIGLEASLLPLLVTHTSFPRKMPQMQGRPSEAPGEPRLFHVSSSDVGRSFSFAKMQTAPLVSNSPSWAVSPEPKTLLKSPLEDRDSRPDLLPPGRVRPGWKGRERKQSPRQCPVCQQA